MEQAKLETAAAAGMTGLRFVAKLKKGKREKRKEAKIAVDRVLLAKGYLMSLREPLPGDVGSDVGPVGSA